ncbi:MAG: DNA repair exonuclease [Opitutaceae bacterium]|nr:DNA repair exonuclease [Opitutaceae bacterium]
MSARFVHTADWQLGKPFAGVGDPAKRALLQHERIAVISRIGDVARAQSADFVLVCGDLFDSPHATNTTVSQACSAIGALGLPVFAIPGNHDHGGPGSLWEQPFFLQESAALAPNLRVLLAPVPVDAGAAVLFPCPLRRRHETFDTTQWLRSPDAGWAGVPDAKPRIVLAHGSTQGFGGSADDDDNGDAATNQIELARLSSQVFDYIALGDWHGTKQVTPAAWYPGTPELDRFPKGGDHDPGNILVVTAHRGKPPEVTAVPTGRVKWHQQEFHFADDAGVEQLAAGLSALLGQRAGQDLLRLSLRGALGIEATTRLERLLEAYEARLIRLKLANLAVVAPSELEIAALTRRASDPLIARVAAALVAGAVGDTEDAATARIALRELHAQVHAA